jgi:hypothetical protein
VHTPEEDDELFGEEGWIQVFLGQGVMPTHAEFVARYCPTE